MKNVFRFDIKNTTNPEVFTSDYESELINWWEWILGGIPEIRIIVISTTSSVDTMQLSFDQMIKIRSISRWQQVYSLALQNNQHLLNQPPKKKQIPSN